MTRLEHLRALLDALARAEDDYVLNGTATAGDVAEALARLSWALREAAPALLDVAEAAKEALKEAVPAPNYGECIIEHGALGIALAPLTEEADHE